LLINVLAPESRPNHTRWARPDARDLDDRITQLDAMVNTATGRGRTKTAMTLVGRQSASVAERCRFAFWVEAQDDFRHWRTPKPPIATQREVLYSIVSSV
jgi:hypothetical protein